MWAVLSLLTGLAGPISQIAVKIADLWLARAKAKTDLERAQIDLAIQESHDRQAILIAESQSKLATALTSGMRFLLALGPLAVLLKIFLWDKVIGSMQGCADARFSHSLGCVPYNTDKLDPNLWWVIFAVIAFYFSYDIISRLKK